MPHAILLGDSIFDNQAYVPGEPAVIEQVRQFWPSGWQATLLARDGAVAEDVIRQLDAVPADATHLLLSAGGNDALAASSIVRDTREIPVAAALMALSEILAEFRGQYRRLLRALQKLRLPTTVCTIYDAVPDLGPAEQSGLSLFNDVILTEAIHAGVDCVELRLVCTEASDYSAVSPIEPSRTGGLKIARTLAKALLQPDTQCRSRIFTAWEARP